MSTATATASVPRYITIEEAKKLSNEAAMILWRPDGKEHALAVDPISPGIHKPKQKHRKRNDHTILFYPDMESFEGKWVTIVDIHYGVQEASKIKYAGGMMFNRDKVAGEVCMAIPVYNAPACKSCMKRFGGKQNPRKGEYLPVGVPYPCPDCGINGDFDDPGMTYNDTQASYASVRRRFEETVQDLGLTTFDWPLWNIDDSSTELHGRKHLWLVPDKPGTRVILKRWKSELRHGTVTFPKPKRDWGAWRYQMKQHKLDDVFSLGLGSMKGGQPSVFVVYVSEEWHLDAPRKIKAKENWGSVPRGEDADVMFAAKEKVDKLLFEPKSELPAWDDPEAITVT
jgi:hypothetical protein